MNDSNDSRMVRLPVREMSDEPAPQRAAQEGDLPPPDFWLDNGATPCWYENSVRLAVAAAGGGVPQGLMVDKTTLYVLNKHGTNRWWATVHPGQDDDGNRISDSECLVVARALASSPQPEAAPAVAQVPQGCGKLCQRYEDGDGQLCGSKCAAAPEAPAQPTKMPIPPAGADALDVAYAEGWNAACDAFFGGKPAPEPLVVTVQAAPEAPAQAEVSERVTEFNVGRWCLSEDDCIAQGIDFSAYELGVADAAKAFGRNTTETPKVAGEPVAWVNRDELDNMLDDRTATVAGIRSGWRETPLYLHPPTGCHFPHLPASTPVKEEAMADEQEALKLADALDLKISAYPPHYTDVDAAAAMLRKLVAEREEYRAAMRRVVEASKADFGHRQEAIDAAITDLRQRLEVTT